MSMLCCLLHGVSSHFSNLKYLEVTRANSGFTMWGAVSTPFGNTSRPHCLQSPLCLSFQRQRGEGTGMLARGWDIPTGASLALASVVIAPPQRMTERKQRRNLGSRESQVSPELGCPSWVRVLDLRPL